jgi:hypothetical protein
VRSGPITAAIRNLITAVIGAETRITAAIVDPITGVFGSSLSRQEAVAAECPARQPEYTQSAMGRPLT